MSALDPDVKAVPLSDRERARGRRLAITSHPFGMTFSRVFGEFVPTLALVALGASETLVGLQSALQTGASVLQLPTLRAVGRVSKRHLLVGGQATALVAALPLLFFARLEVGAASGEAWPVVVALVSLGLTASATKVGETVWFPLLHSYVDPAKTGAFFGLLRSGWHLTLIVYYIVARAWLDHAPGAFGPLFAAAWLCGLARIVMILRLPERSERTGAPIRIAHAFAMVRDQPLMRRYLLGISGSVALRSGVVPFILVMLRREIGFSDADVLYTTVASFGGGLVSLYAWGRVIDRVGPAPVFTATSLGAAALIASLVAVDEPGTGTVVYMAGFFFLYALLGAGFHLADTRVLFGLAPPEAPARTLVVAAVTMSFFAALAPLGAGIVLDIALRDSARPLLVYHRFFLLTAGLLAVAFLPLRRFRRARGEHGAEGGSERTGH